MNSLEIREFTISLQTFVDKSDLPAEVKYMVFHSMTRDLQRMSEEEIQQQLLERKERQEKTE